MTQRTTIFEEGASQVLTVTINEGETESQVFDVGSAASLAFVIDGAFYGTALEVLVAASADGPFYAVASGVFVTPTAAGALVLSPTDWTSLLPFRFLKLRSNADFAAISPLGYLASAALSGDSSITIRAVSADPGDYPAGFLIAGDQVTIEGHVTVYTVTGGPYSDDDEDGTIATIAISPVLEAVVNDADDVTFAPAAVRGETATRTIQVITKD